MMGQDSNTFKIQSDMLECLGELGQDTISILNTCEGNYMNVIYQNVKGTFDFCDKRVVFYKGNVGTLISNKKEYFDKLKHCVQQNGWLPTNPDQLIIFNEDEVKAIGYDAAIVSSSKKFITNKDVVKRLKKKN